MVSFDPMPDKPRGFGFKISWFAVKASDPASVLNALELGEGTPANWASGVAAAYDYKGSRDVDHWVFVSPPISGWVFAVSHSLPYPVDIEANRDIGEKFDLLFSRLMKRFDDVQFFGSHRVVDFAGWARAVNGKLMRVFAWVGSDGEVLANVGEQTPEEAKLGFPDLTRLSPSDALDRLFAIVEQQDAEETRLVRTGLSRPAARARIRQNERDPFPDEIDVVKLAALWSIDPSQLSEQDHPVGVGLAARLPENLAE